MASQTVIEFTDQNFEAEVKNADQPVLVDFWAEWCTPCKALAPTIDELATEFEGKAKIGKLDIDNHQQTAVEFQVSAIPTILLFRDGQVAKKFVGLTSKADLQDAINELTA